MAERTGELVQQEALLRRELDLNCALADLTGALITPGRTIDEIAMLVLSSAEELIGSPHGFVSVVDEKTGVVTSPTLNAMVVGGGLRSPVRSDDLVLMQAGRHL